MLNQLFRILIWIEYNDQVLVTTTRTGEKQLLEVTPKYAETTIEAIERHGKDVLNLHFDVVDFVEQITYDNLSQTETLFLYKASLPKKEIFPKLTHNEIIYWLPIDKIGTIVPPQLLSKMTKN